MRQPVLAFSFWKGLGCRLFPPWCTRCWKNLIALLPFLRLFQSFSHSRQCPHTQGLGSLGILLVFLFTWFQNFRGFVVASLGIPFSSSFLTCFVNFFTWFESLLYSVYFSPDLVSVYLCHYLCFFLIFLIILLSSGDPWCFCLWADYLITLLSMYFSCASRRVSMK